MMNANDTLDAPWGLAENLDDAAAVALLQGGTVDNLASLIEPWEVASIRAGLQMADDVEVMAWPDDADTSGRFVVTIDGRDGPGGDTYHDVTGFGIDYMEQTMDAVRAATDVQVDAYDTTWAMVDHYGTVRTQTWMPNGRVITATVRLAN